MADTFISTYASHVLLDYWFGRTAITIPSMFRIALSTTPLGADGVGLKEPTDDPAYQRLNVDNDKVSFSDAVNRIVDFKKDFIFNTSTKDWGKVTHFAIFDNANPANIWLYGKIQGNGLDVQDETAPRLKAYQNSITLDTCNGSDSDMAITKIFANQMLDYTFGRTPIFTPPANYYLGISRTAINSEGVGITEPTEPEYKRIVVANDKNSFTNAVAKMLTFKKTFEFPGSDAMWGNMTHYFLSTNQTSTDSNYVVWSGRLVKDRNVGDATTLVISPTEAKFTLGRCV